MFLGLKKLDRAKIIKESREFSFQFLKQIYNQIPGISAIAALITGTWIASTFTTSPIKAQLASWGLINGGRHVVGSSMYRFLSIVIPLLVAGITAYLVQKLLKLFRAKQMDRNILLVSNLNKDVQESLLEKLGLLEKMKEAGLLSQGEYETKKANLFQTYTKILPNKVKELLVNKLTG
ncbi:MAG: hypothetical protein HY200_02015 [Nitrospirae bacterium]|nr:hypothetical protein [Nitrospirota bacterium]MBI3593712.1 hypothetical protein [Nitrospirota bacterium]